MLPGIRVRARVPRLIDTVVIYDILDGNRATDFRHRRDTTHQMIAKARQGHQRSRCWYAVTLCLVILAGLLLRSGFVPLSDFAIKYGGVALWALAAFVGFGFLFTRVNTFRLGLISIVFAWAVEFFQLYHAPWVDAIRATRPGHWVLGSTFHAPDLLAYPFGIAVGAAVEVLLPKRRSIRREG
ncbi:MAG TPA: DUF2809 domain-containing protein [Verrucomicrobiae bacterium]